jgi:hypothetical protein
MSFTDIANRALLHLGISNQLTDVATDTSTTATVMYALQDTVLEKTLMAADWDFATWYADLDLAETDPNDGTEYSYSYYLPDGTDQPLCVKPRRLVNGDRTLQVGSQSAFRIMANVTQRYLISGATQANPVVITTSSTHTFSNGDTIYIEGVVGMTEINGLRFTVANKAATTFELSGINGTAYTAYTSGGSASQTASLLYTNEANAQLEYTYSVTDTGLYPQEFSTAMSYMWAYLASPTLTGGDPYGLGQKALQMFTREIGMANARDANKRQPDTLTDESEFTSFR